jgi:hypothetical protein
MAGARAELLSAWRLETFEHDLLEAVRERAPGESFLVAFGRFVLQRRGLLAARDPDAIKFLAALIAAETGAGADDIEPWVAPAGAYSPEPPTPASPARSAFGERGHSRPWNAEWATTAPTNDVTSSIAPPRDASVQPAARASHRPT